MISSLISRKVSLFVPRRFDVGSARLLAANVAYAMLTLVRVCTLMQAAALRSQQSYLTLTWSV